jgi:hypothetical protein
VTPDAENPAAAAAATGSRLSKCGEAFGNSESTKATPTKQVISALRRDFVCEALRIVAVKAAHAADDIEIGDDIAVERGISLTITHLKAAAAEFRQMQAGSL